MRDHANVTARPTDWRSIDWGKANRTVESLRRRIFRATREGDLKKVRSLQKLMLRSHSNRLVSVRRVTQINQGKNTPGVDKVVVKTPAARGKLVDKLADYTPWKPKPARRVYIPKASNPARLRGLGIPVIFDRALQNVAKNALEPFWEAKFEGTSYGFRPGRGCHDAIEKIFLNISKGRKQWILDADLKGAFDAISHKHLLDSIGNFPARELIKQWLKAGYMEEREFHATESGTPQGGVVSPVLLNVALHGMEEALTDRRYSTKFRRMVAGPAGRAFIRYADDFVVLCESKEDAEKCRDILTTWLAPRGLQLSEEKTKIVHATQGFDFLGFNVRRYRTPKSTRSGFKTIIKPSKASVIKLRRRLKADWRSTRGASTAGAIAKLNPVIRGWANYFRPSCAKETFKKIDDWMFTHQKRWVHWRHPQKPWKWTRPRYWGKYNKKRDDRWVFGDKKTGAYLLRFAWFPIERHIMVKGNSSPDDPNLKDYWTTRRRREMKNLKPIDRRLALHQEGLCPQCGNSLFNGEEVHTHHRVPRRDGGTDSSSNLLLLHLYCHQNIHAPKKGQREKADWIG